MPTVKMHADEVETAPYLVRRLLTAQFPQWAGLPIAAVPSAGTDNALYRLGDHMVVRLPRIHWAVQLVDKEYQWLPRLVPHLPLAIPVPLARGEPGEGYPWPWAVYRWLDGEDRTPAEGPALRQMAADLAGFMRALQRIDPTGGPPAGPLNFDRGVPLGVRDQATRAAIVSLRGVLDTAALTEAWEAALAAPAWPGLPVWLHGDLKPGNFLYREGRLSAVIDFGCLGVGDPACDLQVAWNLFEGEARAAFRAALGVDEATWARGKGWALSVGVIALPYYQTTNPDLAAIARRALEAVLADHKRDT